MRVNSRRAKVIWLLIGLLIAFTYISYGLSKNNQAYTFHLLWEDMIRPEAKLISDFPYLHIELEGGYIGVSIRYEDIVTPLYRLFLYNDSGLVLKKKMKGSVALHQTARDGKHILIDLCKKPGSCFAQLYSIKGELLWESKDHDFYRFSADGKHLVIETSSEEYFFKEFEVLDLKGQILWKKKFEEYIFDGTSFNNGRYVLISEMGTGKTYLFDTKDGLLWEKKFKSGGEHRISEDGKLILSYPGRSLGIVEDIYFQVIDLKGDILFEGKGNMKLSEKDTITLPGFWFNSIYIPSFFYKDKVFIEGIEKDYLVDIKGNVETVTIRNDFIRQFALDPKEREHIMLSPNLKYLLYRPQGGLTLKYYRVD